MRSPSLRLTWVFAVALSLAGCSDSPPPAEPTAKSITTLPEGVTKTTKGILKGKMTHEVRKSVGTAGLDE
jgi:hypothetical protein